jgi:hypothetical protein
MVYCLQHRGSVEEAYYCGRVLEAIEASIDQKVSSWDRSTRLIDALDVIGRFATVSISLEASPAPYASTSSS